VIAPCDYDLRVICPLCDGTVDANEDVHEVDDRALHIVCARDADLVCRECTKPVEDRHLCVDHYADAYVCRRCLQEQGTEVDDRGECPTCAAHRMSEEREALAAIARKLTPAQLRLVTRVALAAIEYDRELARIRARNPNAMTCLLRGVSVFATDDQRIAWVLIDRGLVEHRWSEFGSAMTIEITPLGRQLVAYVASCRAGVAEILRRADAEVQP
jgi:hypothetical protein